MINLRRLSARRLTQLIALYRQGGGGGRSGAGTIGEHRAILVAVHAEAGRGKNQRGGLGAGVAGDVTLRNAAVRADLPLHGRGWIPLASAVNLMPSPAEVVASLGLRAIVGGATFRTMEPLGAARRLFKSGMGVEALVTYLLLGMQTQSRSKRSSGRFIFSLVHGEEKTHS
jgi:hypothetical protein